MNRIEYESIIRQHELRIAILTENHGNKDGQAPAAKSQANRPEGNY